MNICYIYDYSHVKLFILVIYVNKNIKLFENEHFEEVKITLNLVTMFIKY